MFGPGPLYCLVGLSFGRNGPRRGRAFRLFFGIGPDFGQGRNAAMKDAKRRTARIRSGVKTSGIVGTNFGNTSFLIGRVNHRQNAERLEIPPGDGRDAVLRPVEDRPAGLAFQALANGAVPAAKHWRPNEDEAVHREAPFLSRILFKRPRTALLLLPSFEAISEALNPLRLCSTRRLFSSSVQSLLISTVTPTPRASPRRPRIRTPRCSELDQRGGSCGLGHDAAEFGANKRNHGALAIPVSVLRRRPTIFCNGRHRIWQANFDMARGFVDGVLARDHCFTKSHE